MKSMFFLATAVFLAALSPVQDRQEVAVPAIDLAIGAALQGDVARALRTLDENPQDTLSAADQAFVTCMTLRFSHPQVPISIVADTDPFIQRVLMLYRAYWYRALREPLARNRAETELLSGLKSLLASSASSMDDIESELQARLGKAGVYSLHGRTGVLRELMIWRSQNDHLRNVELPAGSVSVRVVLLDDFLSKGWGDFATCTRRGAGGWATKDALFAVVPRYESLESEDFRVSFLGHEAQHFADLRTYQPMVPWELEYRAKLTELAQLDASRHRVLRKFREDQSNDPAQPHGYANRLVIQRMIETLAIKDPMELANIPVGHLNAAAATLLQLDSQGRSRRGDIERR